MFLLYNNFYVFPIYLDYCSTCPVDPYIVEKMLPYLYYKYGNFNSKNHIFGWNSEYILNTYKNKLSFFFNCDPRELIWTSGVSESNNTSIKGISFFYKFKGGHIITLNIEHKSILNCINYLKLNFNFNFSYIRIKNNGIIDFRFLNYYFKKNTILFVLSLVNNEIGVFQNFKYISYICKKKSIIIHIDSSQCIGKFKLDFSKFKLDLISISSHKNYGPKGVGVLYIRRKSNIYLNILIHGGNNDSFLRSGTLPNHQIIGFCESVFLSYKNTYFNNFKLKNIKYIFFLELLKIDFINLNGDIKYCIPNIFNVSIDYIEGESLIISIKNLSLSTGSACSSNILEASYVLKSLSKKINIINSSIRITIGNYLKITEIYNILFLLNTNIKKLRIFSLI